MEEDGRPCGVSDIIYSLYIGLGFCLSFSSGLAVLVFVMAGQETGGSDAASGNTNESSDDADLGPVCPNSGLPEIDADCDIDSENRTITCRVNTTTLVEPRHHCNKSYGCLLHFHLHQGHWTYISHCFKDPKRENCHFIPSSSIDKGFPPMNGFRCHCGEHCPTLEDPLHYTHPHEPILVSDSIPSPAPSPSSNNTDGELKPPSILKGQCLLLFAVDLCHYSMLLKFIKGISITNG